MSSPWRSRTAAAPRRCSNGSIIPTCACIPGGPPKRPYDVTAHTLPLLMGVDVEALDAVTCGPLERGHSSELMPSSPASSRGFRYRFLAGESTGSGNRGGRSLARSERREISRTSQKGPGMEAVRRPRIGLYKSFMPSIDEGWTRWLLEQFGFAYTSVGNREIQAGRSAAAASTCWCFPISQSSDLASGYAKGAMPEEFTGGSGRCGRGGAARVRLRGRHAGVSESLSGVRHAGSGRQGEECCRRRFQPRVLCARDRC